MSKERFDIEENIRILGLEMRAEQADEGRDFDVACRIALNKLKKCKEYEDLEEQGLLLRLPCKVGETLYAVDSASPEMHYIYKIESVDIIRLHLIMENGLLGKTVFLTQSEAEEKLRELEGGA